MSFRPVGTSKFYRGNQCLIYRAACSSRALKEMLRHLLPYCESAGLSLIVIYGPGPREELEAIAKEFSSRATFLSSSSPTVHQNLAAILKQLKGAGEETLEELVFVNEEDPEHQIHRLRYEERAGHGIQALIFNPSAVVSIDH